VAVFSEQASAAKVREQISSDAMTTPYHGLLACELEVVE
jgi:hypothetical protein